MANKPQATGQPTVGVQYSPNLPEIDWSKTNREFEKKVQKVLQDFKDAIEKEWNYQAQKEIKTKAAEYMQGVSFTMTDDGVDVTVQGWFPVALEQGTPPYDLKPGFLKGGKTHRVIPFADGGFRTVSASSPPGSWWHPGIKPRGIGEIMEVESERIAKETVEKPLLDYFQRMEI